MPFIEFLLRASLTQDILKIAAMSMWAAFTNWSFMIRAPERRRGRSAGLYSYRVLETTLLTLRKWQREHPALVTRNKFNSDWFKHGRTCIGSHTLCPVTELHAQLVQSSREMIKTQFLFFQFCFALCSLYSRSDLLHVTSTGNSRQRPFSLNPFLAKIVTWTLLNWFRPNGI